MSCVEVHVIRVCGKEAIKFVRKESKELRRRRLLKRLIIEVRQLRRKIHKSNGA